MTAVLYRFEDCVLDLGTASLRRGNEEVDLRPKCFDVLKYLLENAGRLVTKDELISRVWADVAVADEAVTRCMSDVRAAIGDHDQAIIKTVPRRGYILNASVTRHEALKLPDKPSIAVLPFTNLNADPSQEYFSDGITEDIITEVSRFNNLFVIARNSSFQYKGKTVDVRQVGRELGVRYVLEGSIRRAEDRVRITAQLVEAETGAHRWAERYDRQLEDVFAVQDEVARTVATLLAAHVDRAEVERTLLKPPATWQAYDYFIRGAASLVSFQVSGKIEDLYEARRLLERSLSFDRHFARAYALLSHSYHLAYAVPSDSDYLNLATEHRALALARKAVELDPNSAEAHDKLARVLTWLRQHGPAIAEFERALALNPNLSTSGFVLGLLFAGEFRRAIDVGKVARRLDPFCSPWTPGWIGLAYYMLRRYSEALPLLRECVARAPNFRGAHVWMAATYVRLDQLEDAREAAAEVLRIEPTYSISGVQKQLSVFKHPEHAEHLFEALRKAGLPE
jgi:adenylate cyclase